ncbi:MAG: hypothetical protein HYS87_00815 [Candidatus Colwellbacteria bacterium]|nr:hypothetical protein [Candidatus Colwellbacteria bacterium]
MVSTVMLYDEVVKVADDFLGPASGRFIDRQIRTHLHKAPSEMTTEDLLKLIDWMKVSVALLTNDPEVVNKFTSRLISLTR